MERALVLLRMLLSAEPEARVLFFVWTKGEGRLICERLMKEGFRCAFHNAELELDERISLEEAFERGEVQVLVSTTTLAWGRNLSARHVVLFGEKRGPEFVDGWDVIQAGGRSGRPGKVEKGDVWFIVADVERASALIKEPPSVRSCLTRVSPLAFQLLGEIPVRGEKQVGELLRWYSKTFAFTCIKDEDPSDLLLNAIYLLEKCGCAVLTRGSVRLTEAGVIARRFYVKPEEMICLLDVLSEVKRIPEDGKACDLMSLVLTAHSASSTRDVYLTVEERAYLEKVPEVKQWFRKYENLILNESHGYVSYLVRSWQFLNSQNPPQPIPFRAREFVYDMERISEVCISLAREVFGFSEESIRAMKKASLVLRYGAPYEAADLLEIRGIGTKRAIELLKLGIMTKEQLIEAIRGEMRDQVLRIIPLSVLRDLFEEDVMVSDAVSFKICI